MTNEKDAIDKMLEDWANDTSPKIRISNSEEAVAALRSILEEEEDD